MSIQNEMVFWSPGMSLAQLERKVIEKAFRHYRANKTQTAKALDISVRTLENKLERYAKDDVEYEQQRLDAKRQQAEFLQRSRNGNTFDQTGSKTESGVRVESVTKLSKKQSVSVSKSEEIQDLLSETPSEGSPARTSKGAQSAVG